MLDTRFRYAPCLALAALCACQASDGRSSDARDTPSDPGTRTPGRTGVRASTESGVPAVEGDTFAYLLSRYDANGDGTITPDEYTRHEVQLSRWDSNGDAVLTAVDFDVPEPSYEEIGELRKRRVVGRYFQADDEHEVLHVEELETAFAAYEGPGGDWELTKSEFTSRAEERRVALPGDDSLMMQNYTFGDPWQMLLQNFDEDDTGTVALWEVGVYIENQGEDGLRFDLDRCDGGAPGDTFTRIDYVTGLAEGSAVPELEIARLDGESSVALSKFAGEVPVALIFGSYT